MDQNNQYGQAMTKPLPYSCIKKMKTPSLSEFKRILSSFSHEDKIGHSFVLDIKFHYKNPKTMLFNEIYTPIFEKNKIVQARERSTIQLMRFLSRNDKKDIINNFKCTAKTHSTLHGKKFIPLYAEHIHFLVKSAGWLVTAIYQHFTFKQAKFKKDFVIIN